ncbi:hypothetical protein C8J55DRAFT_556942 [Lentinula edodes]|uniref:Uncharacterized protein n=1 Tax=Lentinula lateritia TaxID=40482 RepID=A0A9W9AVA5_9AGAR|nr:hypothetical protein C8J55DRAFT_556942 [Lentinula edodes]
MHSFPWVTLLLLSRHAFCVLNNFTIDDSDPSIRYSPAGAWNARNAAQNCSECTAQPDPVEMLQGTWHDGTFSPSAGSSDYPNTPLFANITFNGMSSLACSAVYVFCALAESTTAPDGNSDMAFYIDGQPMGTFAKPAPGFDNIYEYRYLVFSIDTLALGVHTLVLQNGYMNAPKSLVLLDYIVYSLDDGTGSTESQSPIDSNPAPPSSSLPNASVTGAPHGDSPKIIALAVTIPIVVLLILSLLLFLLRKRWRQHQTILEAHFNWHHRKRDTVVPVPTPALSSWMIEPLSLPPSHPASGYVNGSGRPATKSVPSAPTTSSQQGPIEMPRRSHRSAVSSSASASSYGRVIYIHNLDTS